MEKFLNIYNTNSAFEADSENLDTKEHFVAETMDDNVAHFKEAKVDLPIKPIEESLAADICIVDNGGNKYIVDGNSYSVDLFPKEQYTPIGVVVVPASHTDDGTARIISLAAMDYNNPDNGNTSGHVDIYWGGYDYDVPNLDYKTAIPYITNTGYSGLTSAQTLVGWWTSGIGPKFSSDYYDNEYPNPYDEGTCFGRDDSLLSPSPYLTGGAKNEIYHSTANTGNILADMNGKGNTEKILVVDNGNSTAWQTASTIINTGRTETIHPAAQCCWRFHTTGTTQGDWYLPSAGELGYLTARWKAINTSIDKLASLGFSALSLPFNEQLWSSTEYSDNAAVCLYFLSDLVYLTNFYDKGYGIYCYVRSFLRV